MLDRTAATTLAVIDEAHTIDELGALRARMADLEIAETVLKAKLAHLPEGAYEGNIFRLAVIESVRETPDKTLKAKIKELVEKHLSRQFVNAHIKETPVRTLKTHSRNGKGL